MADQNADQNIAREHFLRRPAVLESTGWSSSTLHRKIHADEFPPGIKISKRIRVWPESAIIKWQQKKLAESASIEAS